MPTDLPRTPPSPARGVPSATVGYCAAFVALGLVSASLGPTLPGLASQTGAPLSRISLLFVGRSTGYLLGCLLGGRLFDRAPGHPVLVGALAVMSGMMALVPLSSLLWALIAVLFVLGLAEGALDVGCNTLLVRVHLHRLDPFMNALHFFFGAGAFLSPLLIVRAVEASGGIAWAYWTLALAILPVAAWFLPLSSPGTGAVSKDGSVRKAHPVLIILIPACFFLFVGAEAGFGGWIYTYALRMNLADAKGAGVLTSAFWGALTLGRLLAIPISARFGPGAILAGDLAGGLVSVGVILAWPEALAALWAGTVGAGLFIASLFATLLNLAGRHVTMTGRVTGWFFVGSSVGGMTVPWVIGQFFEGAGPRAAPWIILWDLIGAVGVLSALMLVFRKRCEA